MRWLIDPTAAEFAGAMLGGLGVLIVLLVFFALIAPDEEDLGPKPDVDQDVPDGHAECCDGVYCPTFTCSGCGEELGVCQAPLAPPGQMPELCKLCIVDGVTPHVARRQA